MALREVLLDAMFIRPVRDSRRSGRSSAVCGRSDGRDGVVDDMLYRTAGKSIRYAGELVVPEPLDEFGDISHFKTASGNSQR